MPTVKLSGSKKIRKTVEKNMIKEVESKQRTYQGFKLEKGIPHGKVVIRNGEIVVIPGRSKQALINWLNIYGTASLQKEPIDDASEGHYNTVEIYKVQPPHGEAYYWFVELI